MSEDKGPHYLYRVVDKSSQFFAQIFSKRTGEGDIEYVRGDLVIGRVRAAKADKALAQEYLKKWGADNQITLYAGLDELAETFAAALATVRREARAEERNRIVVALRNLKENFIPVNQALEVIAKTTAKADEEGESDGIDIR